MASQVSSYTTRELSKKTWPDFERLFRIPGSGWNHCACMHFHRTRPDPKEERLPTRAEKAVRNLREKKGLVEKGCAHGILVYADGEPVGWCLFGPKEELPRIDHQRWYKNLAPAGDIKILWRIPCFVVDKKYRRRGIAGAALKAALEAIRKRGGGLVEAYPITCWKPGTFGNESTTGTASMFEKEGFKTVAPLGRTAFSTHVLMRRTV